MEIKIKQYDFRLRLDPKIDGTIVDLRFSGTIDVLFTPGLNFKNIPISFDSYNAQPRLQLYYVKPVKSERHFKLIEDIIFPHIQKEIQTIMQKIFSTTGEKLKFTGGEFGEE